MSDQNRKKYIITHEVENTNLTIMVCRIQNILSGSYVKKSCARINIQTGSTKKVYLDISSVSLSLILYNSRFNIADKGEAI